MDVNSVSKQKEDMNEFLSAIPPYCEKCGTIYNKSKLDIIDKNPNMTILYIMCENCKNKNIFYVVKPLNFVDRAKLVVDLDFDEIKKFAGSKEINTDDLLNIFDVLASKNMDKAKDVLKIINSNV